MNIGSPAPITIESRKGKDKTQGWEKTKARGAFERCLESMAGARKNGRRLLHTALLLAILGVGTPAPIASLNAHFLAFLALGQTHRVTQKAGSLSVAYLAGSDPWKYVWGGTFMVDAEKACLIML